MNFKNIKTGFTIMELTVVISVLLGLIGLLVTGLKGYLRSTERTACLTNQRLMAQSILAATNFAGGLEFPGNIDVALSEEQVNTIPDMISSGRSGHYGTWRTSKYECPSVLRLQRSGAPRSDYLSTFRTTWEDRSYWIGDAPYYTDGTNVPTFNGTSFVSRVTSVIYNPRRVTLISCTGSFISSQTSSNSTFGAAHSFNKSISY